MNCKRYHVALSYASEQRQYVAEVARVLKAKNVRCFYDKDEEINLWGKNIIDVLKEIFAGGETYFVVIFISNEYVDKAFPRLELQHTLSNTIQENREYILPARFDSTDVPGLPTTTIYANLEDKTPESFAEMIIQKITDMGIYLGSSTQDGLVNLSRVPQRSNSRVTLTVKDESGSAISGADIYFVHENGTHKNMRSSEIGEATFSVDKTNKNFYTIFIAHNDFPASIIDDFPDNTDLNVNIKKNKDMGSMIINGTGYIPGIKGRLDPILDCQNRTYLYAENISVNSGAGQPVRFQFGENISLVDNSGRTADIRIHRIIQQCAIIDYITHKD